MKIAACQEILKHLSFGETCKVLARAGYSGIELAPFVLARDVTALPRNRREEIKEIAASEGIDMVAMHWLLASPAGMSVSSPDPRVRARTRDFFEGLVDLAVDLGVPVLVFGSPKQRDIDPAWDRAGCMEHVLDFFKDMSEKCLSAGRNGPVIAFEPLGPETTNVGGTFQEALDLVRAVDHDHFKLHLDVKAMVSPGEPLAPQEQVRLAGSKLVHVHVNDGNLLGPGMGDTDLRPIIAALKETRYGGWYSVEIFREDVSAAEVLARSIEHMRELLS